MQQLPRHVQYKDSGLWWIGEIPAHWQTRRNRFLFREVDRRSAHGEETHLSMSQAHGLVPSKHLGRKSLQSENYAGGKLVAEHDLVLNRLKAHLGVFARAKQSGVVSPDYTVLRPKCDTSVQYCESLFKTPMYVGEFRRRTKGIVEGFWRLYTDDFYNVEALLPPPEEQDQIVAYLRAQDAHIARFIKTKRELIKLLTEQKLRIIDHAVTRGLDASVTLKPSGIEWLDEVPEHWETVRLRHLSISLQTGPFGSQLHSSDYVDGGTPVINPSHLKNGAIVPDGRCSVDADTVARLSRHCLAINDIVFARRGELGRCALVTAREAGWLCGTGSLKVRLRPNAINTDFLMFVLSSPLLRSHLRLYSVGSTMENANTSIVGNIRFPLPPTTEQQHIVAYIKTESAPLDETIARTEEEIKLIREYRDRLIADVVTGQVDVRGWQPGPDDVVDDVALAALGDDPDDVTEMEVDDGGE